jgi:hypothetical protein
MSKDTLAVVDDLGVPAGFRGGPGGAIWTMFWTHAPPVPIVSERFLV